MIALLVGYQSFAWQSRAFNSLRLCGAMLYGDWQSQMLVYYYWKSLKIAEETTEEKDLRRSLRQRSQVSIVKRLMIGGFRWSVRHAPGLRPATSRPHSRKNLTFRTQLLNPSNNLVVITMVVGLSLLSPLALPSWHGCRAEPPKTTRRRTTS